MSIKIKDKRLKSEKLGTENGKLRVEIVLKPSLEGKLASIRETDDQQEVGDACERQDGKRVLEGDLTRVNSISLV